MSKPRATSSRKGDPPRRSRQRLRVIIRGAVQGVGFRPFVFRLAEELGLSGWVMNSTQGVFVEVEGEPAPIDAFLARVRVEHPPRAYIQSFEQSFLDPVGYDAFEIRESDSAGEKLVTILPDIATCPECLDEILDTRNRRHRYPFTNCTNCGPRLSIIEALPYDRPNTTMKSFRMCPECRKEYEDPRDRRFHAQPNACPACGPQLELWDAKGTRLAAREEALAGSVQAVREGAIVALKGLGGFHLVVDARNDASVRRLRARKHRDEKPLALMYPSLETIADHCTVDEVEKRLLLSPESPIVLLEHRRWTLSVAPSAASGIAPSVASRVLPSRASDIAPSVAPGNLLLGVMLPYTPLHHLLMQDLGFPVVATSGNLSEEPICTSEDEAIERLGSIADVFLVHNRPIARHVDDSVARVVAGRPLILRRARGYAPLPIALGTLGPIAFDENGTKRTTLAVGAHLKNTVALAVGRNVFVSQHIGDMSTNAAFGAFEKIIADFQTLYGVTPGRIACDAHPDYRTTRFAETLTPSPSRVQHHVAHVFSCMAENDLNPPILGVSWDGTGYGTDGTVWGGEFIRVTRESVERVGHLRTFPLPGGEQAIREPRRAAVGLLYEMYGDSVFEMDNVAPLLAFSGKERRVLLTMLQRDLNSPKTSSAGRLFDVVASLLGIRHQTNFEGQAAMELEFALAGVETRESYAFDIATREGVVLLDWEPLIRSTLEDTERSVPASVISAKFHNTLAEAIVRTAVEIGENRVALTGGCFQNRYLTESAVARLEQAGIHAYWHQRIPPNDGGIALGQVIATDYFDSGGENN